MTRTYSSEHWTASLDAWTAGNFSECWEWPGAKTSAGYGNTRSGGKNRLAHRVSYERFVGPIPAGLTLDHLCRNRACINPKHLEPVTMRENNRRGMSPAGKKSRQTHCLIGHPFDEANTYHRPGREGRECRACHRIREAKRKAARR